MITFFDFIDALQFPDICVGNRGTCFKNLSLVQDVVSDNIF